MFRNPWRCAARFIQEWVRDSTVQVSCLRGSLHTDTWCSSVHIAQHLFSSWTSSSSSESVAVFLFIQGEQLKSGSVLHPAVMCIVLDYHQEHIVNFSTAADPLLVSSCCLHHCCFGLGLRIHSGRKILSLLRVSGQQCGDPTPMVLIQQMVQGHWELYFVHG